MKLKDNFLYRYLIGAPSPLAIERSLECEIFSSQEFKRPILDIGCGEGMFAYVLFDEKIDIGIDPNEKELKKAKEYGMYYELIQSYGDSIPKKDGYFNTIYSNSVLEHIPNIEPVLREIYRLLSDNGMFYMTVPTNLFDNYTVGYQLLSLFRMHALAERFRVFYNKFWKHYHYYGVQEWHALLQRNGFKIVLTKEYCSRRMCLLNDALVPFCLISFIMKKNINRWFLFKYLRKQFASVIYFIFRNFTMQTPEIKNNGLVFFALKKSIENSGIN